MINFVSGVGDHHKESVELASAMTQGQWGYFSGINTAGNLKVTEVSTTTHGAYGRDKLCIISAAVLDAEGADSTHEAIASGSMAIAVVGEGSGIIVEDDYLVTSTLSAADFSAMARGEVLYLNSEGYPTDDGASDYDGGSTAIGEFLDYTNGIVRYRIY